MFTRRALAIGSCALNRTSFGAVTGFSRDAIGAKGRPVPSVVVKHLLQLLETPPSESKNFDEQLWALGLPMAASSALKLIVGAKKIMIPFENPAPAVVSRFSEALNDLAANSEEDKILRDDATRYLRILA